MALSNWSLRAQVITLILIVSLAILGSFCSSAYFALDTQMLSNIKNRANSVASITADNVIPGIEFGDRTYIVEVIGALFNDLDIEAAFVFDSDSNLIYEHFRQNEQHGSLAASRSGSWEIFEHDDDYYLAKARVERHGTDMGEVIVVLTKEHQQALTANTLNVIISLAISILLLATGFGYFAARKILKPIETLKTAAVNIKNSETLTPIETRNLNHDFLALGQAFNEMQVRLKDAFSKLAESRDELERRVEERTKQLVEKLRELKIIELERRERLTRVQAQKSAISELTTSKVYISGNLAEACGIINEISSKTLDVARVSIWVFNAEGGKITCIDQYTSKDSGHSHGMTIEEAAAPDYFKNLSKYRVMACDDAQSDPRTIEFKDFYLIPNGITSMLDASIRVAGKTTGIICFEHIGPNRHWHTDEIKFADEVASQVGLVFTETERREIAEEKRSLDEKYERAQRMESLGVLAGGVAHDLNNMLGPVVGYTELLLTGDLPDEKIRRKIERIASSAANAADVIQDLLALARRGRYEMAPLYLNDVVKNYCDSPAFLKMVESHPEIKYNMSLAEQTTMLTGSAAHLEKVVMNLVHNASEAINGPGSIEISTEVTCMNRLVYSRMNIPEDNYVALQVKDTGSGIAPDELEKIFEPYFSKKVMGRSGSGLGLSVVYGILKDHKGYYDIKSEPGKGTEFILYFPQVEKEAKVIPVETQTAVIHKDTKLGSVLVIDDCPEQREIAQAILENLGYSVYMASNGHEGVRFLEENDVDLVTLDMIMEDGYDGLDTFQDILKFKPNQRAIVVSGYSATSRVQKMLDLGAAGYVKKPYSITELNHAIQEALEIQPCH